VPTDPSDPAVLVTPDRTEPALSVVTINRPDRRNSLTLEVKEALVAALERVAADEGTRAVILTGTGRAFCVGQDLGEHVTALRADAGSAFETVELHYNRITTALATMPKPVVAAVNGTAAGAGLGFALACDLRLAAEGAVFATAFSAIGLTADSGLSATLARSVGTSRAAELLLLGDSFDAAAAEELGLVRQVVPAEELAGAALELGRRLAAGPTRAYAEIKRALATGAGAPLEQVLAAEGAGQRRLGTTQDHAEAVDAFLAKRRPTFEGR
jgi:2-(1,2-epoxy-1,2-dihydrophenyl)acetyl-CoA isomerase